MSRPTRAYINGAALQHNLQRVRELAPHSRVLAMVKANGYGHDLVTVAHNLQNADAFGVACIEEAMQLRKAGITHPIVLVEGFFHPAELDLIVQENFQIVLHQAWQVNVLMQLTLAKPLHVWLKIDTGMHRLGLLPEELWFIYDRLQRCNNVIKPLLWMTHFAEADAVEKPTTQLQIDHFYESINQLPGEKSLANSAGIIAWPQAHAEWVRPGIMLFGASPFADHVGTDYDLRPVMNFSSELIAIRHCRKGDAIGYGSAYVCPENMPVGVVAAGYGDGYPWQAAQGTPMLINEQRVPIVGRISMDMISVDLRDLETAKVGDKALLWGDGLPAEIIAKSANTIAYELFCGITSRVKMEVI